MQFQLEEKMSLALENYFFSRNQELLHLQFNKPRNPKIPKKVGMFKTKFPQSTDYKREEPENTESDYPNSIDSRESIDFIFKSHIWTDEGDLQNVEFESVKI